MKTFLVGMQVKHIPSNKLATVLSDDDETDDCTEVQWHDGIGIDKPSGCGPEEYVLSNDLAEIVA